MPGPIKIGDALFLEENTCSALEEIEAWLY
jgi:hypothetical protein